MSTPADPGRGALVALVERILAADAPSESELDALIEQFASLVPHPVPSDLIHYPPTPGLTAAQIVEIALAYAPVPLPGSG